MNIALFGGTFDPIHLGHTDMIRQVCEALPIDRVVFLPAFRPPHKLEAHTASYADRFSMVELAIEKHANWTASNYESTNAGPSYTFNTLCHFREKYKEDVLYYVMGQDSFNNIETWYRWKELLTLCHFVIIARKGYQNSFTGRLKTMAEERDWKLHFLPLETLPVSSSFVREMLVKKRSTEGLLDEKVAAYIREHHLYMG